MILARPGRSGKHQGTKFTKPGDRLLAEPCTCKMLPVPCLNMKFGGAERAVGLLGHGDVIGAVGESLCLLGLGRRHFTTRE